MSRTYRSLAAGARDLSPILVGVIPFGLVTGAAVAEAGFGLAEAVGMSTLVFAGAAQLAATTLAGEGTPALIVILTALVINARHIIYSTSIAPVLEPDAGRKLPLLGYLLIDQSYGITMTKGLHREDVSIVPYFVGSGLMLWTAWQITNVIGVLAGSFVPASWSLDFAVPLVFLAMLVPALKTRADTEAAVVSGVSAVVLIPLLPLQTGLLAAILIGMTWGAFRHEEEPPR